MALEMKIPLKGGANHSKGYVMITDVRFCRKPGGNTFAMVDIACFTSKIERNKGSKAHRLPSRELDKKKYDLPATLNGDPFAWAYEQLKVDSSVTSIGTIVDV